MSLILAIASDRRQVSQLAHLVRERVGAELVLADTTERALESIGSRVPDLILVPALLSQQDDAALAAALRGIPTAAHVQMLTIPTFAAANPRPRLRGVLSALRGRRSAKAALDGCDPAMFAEQIASYLERANEERVALTLDAGAESISADPPPPAGQAFVDRPSTVDSVEAPPVSDVHAEPWTAAVDEDREDGSALDELLATLERAHLPIRALHAEQWMEAELHAETPAELLELEASLGAFEPVVPVEACEPLPLGAWHSWPRLEGVVAEVYEESPARRTAATHPDRVELMNSLRQDIERQRAELAQPAPAAYLKRQPPQTQATQPAQPPKRGARASRPIEDEWGLFDPEQCGFAALLDKLDQIMGPPGHPHARREA